MAKSETVYLLDASIYVFRAWFGYPETIVDVEGRAVNAVYGYWRLLVSRLATLRPGYLLVAFDESLFSGFRHSLYPSYKGNRALPDDSLAYQLDLCRELTESLGLAARSSAVYEADDLLAAGAAVARKADCPIQVVSRDKDLAQLVQPGDLWCDWSTGSALDFDQLTENWGVEPQQIPDVLALAGDSVDNIPGLPGVGKKTAVALIRHFGDLESLFRRMDELLQSPLKGEIRGAAKLRQRLEHGQADALLFRELIRLHPGDDSLLLHDMRVPPPDTTAVKALLKARGLGRQFLTELERYGL